MFVSILFSLIMSLFGAAPDENNLEAPQIPPPSNEQPIIDPFTRP